MSVAEDIREQNEYCCINKWHEKGVTGKGIVVWNCEARSKDHGEITERRITDAAPGATVITVGYDMVANSKEVTYNNVEYKGKNYSIEEFISTFGIRILTKSVGGGTATDRGNSKFWNALKEKYNLIFFTAAGNESTEHIGGAFPPDVAMLVGACTLTKGKPKRANYSSVGKELDFMAYTGVWSGTSFASPYLAGMAALLCEKYKGITQNEIYQYFLANAEDLEAEGKDNNTGYGLAKMSEKMMIQVPIGSNCIYVDGYKVAIDQPAIIDKSSNRTLVPLRAICEIMGAEVEWDNTTRSAIIKR